MKKNITLSLILLIAIVAVFLSIGNWLVVNDDINKSDVIIVISGGQGERVKHAVKLFQEHFADTLIISGCPGEENINEAIPMRDMAVQLGVSSGNIILDVLERHGLGTGVQAVTIREIMKKHHFKSAILVTSNYHTRRALFIFKRAFKNTDIKLSVTNPADGTFKPKEWWKSKKNFKRGVIEIVKLLWYWISYSGK